MRRIFRMAGGAVMKHGVVEALVFTAALLAIFGGTAIWARFQPALTQPPAATLKVPPASGAVQGDSRATFSLVTPAAAADASAGTGLLAKAESKSKARAGNRHSAKAKKPNRSIANVPKAPTT